MNKAWLLAGILATLVIIIPPVSYRIATLRAIAKIDALQGRTGDFAEITRSIRTRYRPVESRSEFERAATTLGLTNTANLYVVRFGGEGLPYFYGWVAYDTNKHQVIKVVTQQLW